MTGLHVPHIEADDDPLTAALKYAAAGWYVLPVKAGSKHPGSVVGEGWHHMSSRDPEVIVSWWAGTSHGIALHCGRSGAVVFDVDNAQLIPDVLAYAIERDQAPFQSTRTDDPERGHYLFAQPPGRMIGNGWGTLGKAWGEVRGRNGVIIVSPSRHKEAAKGGRYEWVTAGPVPVLPPELSQALPESAEAADAATDAQVSAFLDKHTEAARPELLEVWCHLFAADVTEGASRHQAMLSKAAGAMSEAAAGLLEARASADTLESMFLAAVATAPTTPKQGAPRSGAVARNEWAGILSWAIAQADAADTEQTRQRASAKVPDVRALFIAPPLEAHETTPEPTGEPQEAERPTWAPVDLRRYLDGSHVPVVPTLLTRADGVSLIYPGLTHSFHGESESGKSMLLQIEAARLIMAGERVLFLDFESDAGSLAERLLMFGATPEAILERFVYVRPEVDPRTATAELEAWGLMLGQRFALAVVDGVTDSLGMFGYATKDNDDITAWMRVVPKNIATRTGAAVAVIDHVTKDNDSRGRFAIGGQAKMSGLTGAGYTVEVAEPLGRGLRGVIVVRVGKDRPGYVRGESGPMRKSDRTQEAARVVVDSTGERPVVTVEAWRGSDGAPIEAHAFRLTGFMEKISHTLEASPEPMSFRSIDALVKGKQEHIANATEQLVTEGYVSRVDGPRNSKMHAVIKVYRQAEDPHSDMFKAGETLTVSKRLSTVSDPYTGDRETDTQPYPGDSRETVGRQSAHGLEDVETGICHVCRAQETAPGREICRRCDTDNTSTSTSERAAS